MNQKKRCLSISILVIILSSLNLQPYYLNSSNNSINSNNLIIPHSSAIETHEKQWLKNNNFLTQDSWFSTKGQDGDNSTVDADISNGEANFHVLGEQLNYTLFGVPNSTDSPNWYEFAKPGYYLPDNSDINSFGCRVSHSWNEGSNQFPGVHWRKNVSLNKDMSKYNITSAELKVKFNASVVTSPGDNPTGGVDVLGESDPNQFGIGDFVTFYVLISDIDFKNPYIVALNKTVDLGKDSSPSVPTITDSLIHSYGEDVIITALNSAFEKDGTHSNFTLTLGIDIYCEDNFGDDRDTFNYLFIKECNFTFTYERKMEKFTTLSWNQIGNNITGDIQIINANLNFKYKIDQLWPTNLSPFSEIRVLINDNPHSETIRLSSADLIYDDAKVGGFDITNLILKNVNLSLSIQIFIGNTFGFDKNITLSIDDVYLNITYSLTVADYNTQMFLFLNGENKTTDPYIEVPLGDIINITIKYTNDIGSHLSGATIQLIGPGFVDDFDEDINLEYYSIILNSTEKLSLGLNYLTVRAQLTNYQTKELNPSISVRKINGGITTTSGLNTVNIKPGEDVQLTVLINNTDFGGLIKGVVIFYSGDLGQGVLTDPDNNGIYEGTLRNIQEGSYVITLTALGGENYEFESFQLTINAIKSIGPNYTWLIIALSCGIVGLVLMFSLYQFHYKYPAMVRKIRKLRKKMKKEKKIKPIITLNRKEIIQNSIYAQLEIIDFIPEIKKI